MKRLKAPKGFDLTNNQKLKTVAAIIQSEFQCEIRYVTRNPNEFRARLAFIRCVMISTLVKPVDIGKLLRKSEKEINSMSIRAHNLDELCFQIKLDRCIKDVGQAIKGHNKWEYLKHVRTIERRLSRVEVVAYLK